MTTDTSERGLERLIYAAPTGESQNPASDGAGNTHERLAAYGPGWPATVCLAPLRHLFATQLAAEPGAARASTRDEAAGAVPARGVAQAPEHPVRAGEPGDGQPSHRSRQDARRGRNARHLAPRPERSRAVPSGSSLLLDKSRSACHNL